MDQDETSETNDFICWRPGSNEAYFGKTPAHARALACRPVNPDDPQHGWAKLAAAGWRVDAFPHTVLTTQSQASDDDLMQRVAGVGSIPYFTPDIEPAIVLALLYGRNDDTYREIDPKRAIGVFMGQEDTNDRFGMGDKQSG